MLVQRVAVIYKFHWSGSFPFPRFGCILFLKLKVFMKFTVFITIYIELAMPQMTKTNARDMLTRALDKFNWSFNFFALGIDRSDTPAIYTKVIPVDELYS